MTTNAGAKKNNLSQNEIYSAYFNLHTALREAYWSTPDKTTGDKITGVADACYDILKELNRLEIKEQTNDYKKLKRFAEETNDRLKNVKKEIDQTIQSVSTAVKVADRIEEVLKLATTFFA